MKNVRNQSMKDFGDFLLVMLGLVIVAFLIWLFIRLFCLDKPIKTVVETTVVTGVVVELDTKELPAINSFVYYFNSNGDVVNDAKLNYIRINETDITYHICRMTYACDEYDEDNGCIKEHETYSEDCTDTKRIGSTYKDLMDHVCPEE